MDMTPVRLCDSLTGVRLQHIYKKQLRKVPTRLLKLLLGVYVFNRQLSHLCTVPS